MAEKFVNQQGQISKIGLLFLRNFSSPNCVCVQAQGYLNAVQWTASR